MKTLDLPSLPKDASEYSDELLPAYKESCKIILEYLKGKRPGGDVVTKAANTASTFSRIVASEQNKVALRMQGMRILSEGSEEGEPKKITSIK
jgi:hypothetical protein